ncbi:hypothetical protein J2X97_002704 [Epilithonimonas hungarica]|uniref:T9SS type A sorting domain-containing protein n=1 Tax=Epilithonimonas hungarica TaxID=454006 RepID=UPI00278A36CB|nr:T9SS type A sorting domain-containing protein [Epilithonimonas hungarica]MDP9957038.1 hypothetical protein [Epilithonimonas hungarica]
MIRIIIFLLLVPFLALSQGMIPYNTHVAITSGNWTDCNTWNNPIRIYSSREKIINNGVTVNQNLLFTTSNKITFNGNGKIVLDENEDGNKIFLTGNATPINCGLTGANSIVDNIIVDFATDLPVKSQTGFLSGLGGVVEWNQDTINKLPLRSSISLLKPRMFRQGKKYYYQESFDLTKPSPTEHGRVHMIVAEEWISQHAYPQNPCADYRPNHRWSEYENYLDDYFNWGDNKPGIVWECWNEPDGTMLEPYIPRLSCLSPDYNCAEPNDPALPPPTCAAGDESIDYWPSEARQNFYEIYKHFHQRLRASSLPSTAQIAGPSYGYFNKVYLKEFFDYCLANNLEVNVVTWHEINWPNLTKPYTLLKEHVDYVRTNFKDNPKYAALKIQSIEINEIVTHYDRNNPAGILASIGALESAEVDYACKSCWENSVDGLIPVYGQDGPDEDTNPDIINGTAIARSSCADNSLNDLYTVSYMENPDGSYPIGPDGLPILNDDINNPNKPKSAWWVYKLYGDGVDTRVKSYNEEGRSVVLASKPSSSNMPYAQVLFGYVKRVIDDPAASYLPDVGTYKLRLDNLSSFSSSNYFKITVNKIPYNDELDIEGRVLKRDNIELIAPVLVAENCLVKDSSDGITYEFDAEKENLYQMVIESSTASECLSISAQKQITNTLFSEELTVYPNPTNNYIVVNYKGNSTGKFDYRIIDLTGRIILSGSSEFSEKINIRNLTIGNYIIQIQTENGLKVDKKLIKN